MASPAWYPKFRAPGTIPLCHGPKPPNLDMFFFLTHGYFFLDSSAVSFHNLVLVMAYQKDQVHD